MAIIGSEVAPAMQRGQVECWTVGHLCFLLGVATSVTTCDGDCLPGLGPGWGSHPAHYSLRGDLVTLGFKLSLREYELDRECSRNGQMSEGGSVLGLWELWTGAVQPSRAAGHW